MEVCQQISQFIVGIEIFNKLQINGPNYGYCVINATTCLFQDTRQHYLYRDGKLHNELVLMNW